MAYYESDRYANRRANRNYGNERNRRYEDDDLRSRSYGNTNWNERRNRSNSDYGSRPYNERGSMWADNDHGRASWYEPDYGWRSTSREDDEDNYRGERNRYGSNRSSYEGGYDNDEGDYGRYSSRGYSRDDEYSSRRGRSDNYGSDYENRGRGRQRSDYGTGFNEDNGRMSNRPSDYDSRSRYESFDSNRNRRSGESSQRDYYDDRY